MAESTQFLTNESIETLMRKYPAVAEAAAQGVDISGILEMLRLTVAERIHRLEIASNTLNHIRKAVK